MPKPDLPPEKKCNRCGALFVCTPEDVTACHCSKVDLTFEETRYIAGRFGECLCHTCLLELKQQHHTLQRPKAIFSWSGGKDSAYALYKVLQEKLFDVKYLLTSVNANLRRISMHGVREELLELQASSIGIPLLKVEVSEGTNSEYEKQMEAVLLKAKSEGIECVIFGDIFLEDLRAYREANLAKVNMKAVFPLWKVNTAELVHDFIRLKFKTIICCTNDAYLNEDWPGRKIDQGLIGEMPANVDPCGENGEYHTFCYDGPLFSQPIHFTAGEKIYKPLEINVTDSGQSPAGPVTKGFWFIDLLVP